LDRIRTFYEEKALEYPEVDRPAQARCQKAIRIASLRTGMRVLDIACKDAVLLGEMRALGVDVSYVGIDISERVIEKSKSLGLGGEFLVSNVLEGTPFPTSSFDRIFALEIMEHLPDPARLLTEARRLLKDDGRLLLSVPNPYYYMDVVNELRGFPDTDGHLFSFTSANLHAFLELHGFEVEETIGTFFLIPKTLRGAFRTNRVWVVKHVPELLARSRVYRCKKR
jgi:SAM-dependent methyltransferase